MSAPRGALPEEGSIQEGKVVRVEPYGAFVDLTNFYRVRGLVHISQLSRSRVEKVDDVLAVDDGVWVKVLNVSSEVDSTGRLRHKVSLSLKDASQDGECVDLGVEQEHQMALQQRITQNLQSSIGMGVAMDPMAQILPQRKSNLIFKHQPLQSQTVINGYALVDDDEPEPNPEPTIVAKATDAKPAAPTKPMGRGRGATLPAWMTRPDQEPPERANTLEAPSKLSKESGQFEDGSADDSSHSSDRKHKKRKHKEHKKKKRKRKHKDRRSKSSKRHRRSDDDRKRSRRRERSYSPSTSHSRSAASSSESPPRRQKNDAPSPEDRPSRGRDGTSPRKERRKHDRHRDGRFSTR